MGSSSRDPSCRSSLWIPGAGWSTAGTQRHPGHHGYLGGRSCFGTRRVGGKHLRSHGWSSSIMIFLWCFHLHFVRGCPFEPFEPVKIYEHLRFFLPARWKNRKKNHHRLCATVQWKEAAGTGKQATLEHPGNHKSCCGNCKRAGGKGVGAGLVSGPKKMRPVAWRVWCGEICIYIYTRMIIYDIYIYYIWWYDVYIYKIHLSADSSNYALLYAFRYPLKTHEHTLTYIYIYVHQRTHTHTLRYTDIY